MGLFGLLNSGSNFTLAGKPLESARPYAALRLTGESALMDLSSGLLQGPVEPVCLSKTG